MYGTPFWGNEYFKDVRNLENLEYNTLTIEKINELCKQSNINIIVKDLYSVFLALCELDLLYIIEDEGTWLSWCKDVRFNYRDRYIFVPYYTYDTEQHELKKHFKDMGRIDLIDGDLINVKYNFELKTHILDDRRDKTRVKELKIYDHKGKKKYIFNIEGLGYIGEDSFSIKELYKKYLNSSFEIKETVETYEWGRYNRVDNKYMRNREHLVRKELGLPTYKGKFNNIAYKDCRQYTYEELNNGVSLVTSEKPYWLRNYEFEAYLYCIFGGKLKIQEEEYMVDFNELGKTKRSFSYKEGDKALILKHYYTDNTMKVRRKSYERYGV